MKIALPSLGILGCKSVDIRQPKFEDLRSVQSLNQEEPLLKLQFTQRLLDSKVDLNKITKMDMDYLFVVAAFVIQFNTVKYKFTCSCGEVVEKKFNLAEQDIIDLPKFKHPYKRLINGTEYQFHLLSAQQAIDACEYALNQEDFDSAYEDACAAFILGKTLGDIEWVKSLDASVFLAAFLFQKANFHGVRLSSLNTCPKCHKTTKVNINASSKMVRMELNEFMDQYTQISDMVSFEGFLDFTVPEFKAYVEALNAKVK